MHKPNAAPHTMTCPPSLIMQLLPYLDCIDTSVEALKQNEADLQKNPKPNKPTPEKEQNNKQTQLQMTETCLCCLYFTGLRLPLKYLEQLSWLSMTQVFWEWVKPIEARGCNFGNWYLKVEGHAKRRTEVLPPILQNKGNTDWMQHYARACTDEGK